VLSERKPGQRRFTAFYQQVEEAPLASQAEELIQHGVRLDWVTTCLVQTRQRKIALCDWIGIDGQVA
jgi:hypothetical protein